MAFEELRNRTWIDVSITPVCNLGCSFCGQSYLPREQVTLSVEDVADFFGRLPVELTRATTYIWGGEPTLAANLTEMITWFRERGAFVMVASNGSRLGPAFIDRLVDSGPSAIVLSIDGWGASHDKLRQRPGLYKFVRHAIRHLVDRSIPVFVNTCLIPPFDSDYSSLADDLFSIGIQEIRFSLPLWISQQDQTGLSNELKASKFVTAFEKAGAMYRDSISSVCIEHLCTEMARIKAKFGTRVFLPWAATSGSYDAIGRHFDENVNEGPHPTGCRKIDNSICLSSNGRVVGCPDIPSYVGTRISDVGSDELLRWYTMFRNRFHMELWPWCMRCCHAQWSQ